VQTKLLRVAEREISTKAKTLRSITDQSGKVRGLAMDAPGTRSRYDRERNELRDPVVYLPQHSSR
jgi:hypothetical protein